MRVAAFCGLDELVHDVLGRRLIGIAHSEVDDVLATRARLGLQRIDDVEDIGRQALNAREIVDQSQHAVRYQLYLIRDQYV